ncbi:hypothetical protein [Paractinoplanes toevensis]|uniref:hypothetical protein n=1 Tax=Paractinoplanes toevensis TaxID=571911 RepID=UPI001BB39CB8|nr:hypothetical protein [Actinoplanes toevensis]
MQLTVALKEKFAAGKAGKSAVLANEHAFKAAKDGTGPAPKEAVLYLQNRGDFHAGDFHRKADDLKQLSQDEALYKAEPDRGTVYHKQADGFGRQPGKRSITNVFRDRVITRLSKTGKRTANDLPGPRPVRSEANKTLLDKLYAGKGTVRKAGDALDPDHIHELQLKGRDEHSNLRLMDAWTNREMGRDISVALRDVPPGTRVIVRLVE